MERIQLQIDQRNFMITKLPVIKAFQLLGLVSKLLNSRNLIHGLALQQIMQNVLQTGVEIEGVDKAELESFAKMDDANIISYLVTALLTNINDEMIESLIYKSLSNVVEINGTIKVELLSQINEYDLVTISLLLKEVFLLNFKGALERIKKHLSPEQETLQTT